MAGGLDTANGLHPTCGCCGALSATSPSSAAVVITTPVYASSLVTSSAASGSLSGQMEGKDSAGPALDS